MCEEKAYLLSPYSQLNVYPILNSLFLPNHCRFDEDLTNKTLLFIKGFVSLYKTIFSVLIMCECWLPYYFILRCRNCKDNLDLLHDMTSNLWESFIKKIDFIYPEAS